MNKLILGTIVVALVATAIPAQAGHTQEIVAAEYIGGGSAGFNAGTGPQYGGGTVCIRALTTEIDPSISPPCTGGDIFVSEAHADAVTGDAATWDAEGYHSAEAIANDGVFGTNTAFVLCIISNLDWNDPADICNGNHDVSAFTCGAGSVTANTADYEPTDDAVAAGFGFLAGSVFVLEVYVDATTNQVCAASTGTIDITLT